VSVGKKKKKTFNGTFPPDFSARDQERKTVGFGTCVCVCVCDRERNSVCVCVSVFDREREVLCVIERDEKERNHL
jgi:hypothetical protein